MILKNDTFQINGGLISLTTDFDQYPKRCKKKTYFIRTKEKYLEQM